MTESDKPNRLAEVELTTSTTSSPLVFISHDSRDAELAEAFGKLLKSVSAGMIKTFLSSSKKGSEGIDFGEEWYKRLMTQLQSTSDVVCLFTERSIDRPWILFEAGVAKGMLSTPVIGVALGVPLSRISVGPFYQFQNMDDSEADLTKLVDQLAKRVSSLELDSDVVEGQVATFKVTEASLLEKLKPGSAKPETQKDVDESAVAKLTEEMKALPSRIAERLAEVGDSTPRRRFRRFNPRLYDEFIRILGVPGDPVALLMMASLVRDDMPWLYELAMEVYRAVKEPNLETIKREMERLSRFRDMLIHSPFLEEFGGVSKESQLLAIEFPRMIEYTLMHALEPDRASFPSTRKPHKSPPELTPPK
jgi:hypothetical protein